MKLQAILNSKRGIIHALFCFGYLITEMDRAEIAVSNLNFLVQRVRTKRLGVYEDTTT